MPASTVLGRGNLQAKDLAVSIAVSVAVATVGPIRRHGTVLGPADAVRVGREQGVDEGGEHVGQQIGAGLGEALLKEAGRVDTLGATVIVVVSFEMDLRLLSKDHPVAVVR